MNGQTFQKTRARILAATVLGLVSAGLSYPAQAQSGGTKGASQESMPDMPRLREKQVVTVTGEENWDEIRGFGKDSEMTGMLTLMMVGGSGMEHMRMGAMKMGGMGAMAMGSAPASGGLPVSVMLTPNPPVVGDNALDVAVTDASGKPVTGLKLVATVAMTSMDMGTTRPKVVEGKDGHYAVTANFSMKGPWQVMLMTDSRAKKVAEMHTALNFNVDGKTKWAMPTSPDKTQAGMGGMKMPDMQTAVVPTAKMPDTVSQNPPKTSGTPAPASPPVTAAPKKKIPVSDSAPAKPDTGNAPDTGKSAPEKPDATPTAGYKVMLNTAVKSLKVGKNMLDVTILDPDGKPVAGAKVTAVVEMTSMDMGVTKPATKEGKSGHYATNVQFNMKGSWRVTMTVAPPKQKPFTKAFDLDVK